MERRPYTLNTHYLDSNRSKHLAALKQNRTQSQTQGRKQLVPPSSTIVVAAPMTPEQLKDRADQVCALLASMGQTGITPDDLAKLAPVDEYEREMDPMAQTSAYWKVAYKVSLLNLWPCR